MLLRAGSFDTLIACTHAAQGRLLRHAQGQIKGFSGRGFDNGKTGGENNLII
jgi:hypothetical protein